MKGFKGKIKLLLAYLNVSQTSFYRYFKPKKERKKRPSPPHSYSQKHKLTVREILNSPKFADKPVAAVFIELLDEGKYYCSIRTMYRILAEYGEINDRRNQRKHAEYTKPELLAKAPKQVWSWDITKLRGPAKWNYYYLYVILDIYSRRTVGWMIADRESKELAKQLIKETYMREQVNPEQLIIHSDRGSSMKSKTLLELYTDLGVCRSLSRPRVSNDNPFSEAQFKTLKYKQGYPDRFGSIQDARAYCDKFFNWYNYEHKHSGIAYMTPDQMHNGLGDIIYNKRKETLYQAYLDMPDKFHKVPVPPKPPKAVWINPPDTTIQ